MFAKYEAGLEVDIVDATTFRVRDGSVSLYDTGTWLDPVEVPLITVDLTTVGLNGRDASSLTNGPFYVYLCRDPSTGEIGALASRQITYGNVTWPAGFTERRKLRRAVVYKNGLLAMHYACYPVPMVTFTAELFAGSITSTGWQEIDMSAVMPDNARLAILRTVMSGADTHGWLANSSSGANSRLVHYGRMGVNAGIMVRAHTSMSIWGKINNAAATMDVYLEGFCFTEPS